jgi:putative membrane protein
VTMALNWQADPTLIGGLLTLALVYGLLIGPLRQRLAPSAPFPTRQAALFYAALVVFYLAEGSPLHDLAEIYLFTAHMTQHLLLSYVVALLLIVGTPVWILRPLLLNRFVKPFAKPLTHPVTAALVFSLFFSGWHFPAIYEGALQSDIVHHGEHLVFIATAILMWWPLLSPLPGLPRLSNASQLLYLFALTLGQFLVTAILVLATGPFYPTYAAAPRVSSLSVIADQQLGGVVMKVVSAIVYSLLFVLAFFRWYRAEHGVRTPPGRATKHRGKQV